MGVGLEITNIINLSHMPLCHFHRQIHTHYHMEVNEHEIQVILFPKKRHFLTCGNISGNWVGKSNQIMVVIGTGVVKWK